MLKPNWDSPLGFSAVSLRGAANNPQTDCFSSSPFPKKHPLASSLHRRAWRCSGQPSECQEIAPMYCGRLVRHPLAIRDPHSFRSDVRISESLHGISDHSLSATAHLANVVGALVGFLGGLALLSANTNAAFALTPELLIAQRPEPPNLSHTAEPQPNRSSFLAIDEDSDALFQKNYSGTKNVEWNRIVKIKGGGCDKGPCQFSSTLKHNTALWPRTFKSNSNAQLGRHSAIGFSRNSWLSDRKVVREAAGDSSGIDYEQIVQSHDDPLQKRGMFTGDAWMGMMRLQKYNVLLDSLEEKEKLCSECTRNRRLLEQVWQTVSNEYYDQYGRFSQAEWSEELFRSMNNAGGLLQTKSQTYKVAKEMVARLGDRYSSFLNPEEYRLALHRPIPSELKYLAYQYTGIGMEIGKRCPDGGLTIIAPFAGSPAEEAGILGGERLLSIDGFPVDGLTTDEAVTLLRGPIGSLVELEVTGVGHDAVVRTLLLERRALPLPPLKTLMMDVGDGRLMAYIRLHYFTHEGTKRMAATIRDGEALGVDGYILDLRNNPGGVFEEAIAMAALWLDCKDCNIAETVRSNAADVDDLVYKAGNLPKDIFSRHPGVLTHAPLVTISNRNSASASEVILGALHDNHRTLVIGERTFGKGVVQYYFPMDDGSGLKLTVAKYLTPARYDISKQGGLPPDKLCGDYPHAKGIPDQCMIEALGILQSMVDLEQLQEHKTGMPVPAPMPYRWMPHDERRLWTRGTY